MRRVVLLAMFVALAAFSAHSAQAGPPPGPLCLSGPNLLCLNGTRFAISVEWTTPDTGSGMGRSFPISDDTGSFWFFSSTNLEMLVKVLNGCGVNDHYWVFAGGLTNLEVQITVVDTLTHTTRTYNNPQGSPFEPIQDTAAFATCP
jgi:hypothetical protein